MGHKQYLNILHIFDRNQEIAEERKMTRTFIYLVKWSVSFRDVRGNMKKHIRGFLLYGVFLLSEDSDEKQSRGRKRR